ncbi:hypothetical protein ParKJ_12625 [Paraburkholderia fungorum]|jgi:general stress protein CsbA|uniref:O-antigen ligase domain-containing protein n=1 Tax=Paraburkholderia fungorum TaxID=134537 RepID=A0AAP5UVS8_9BURK|nr:hypothetical protein [Paraburkholderia fungorum]MDT8838259.1 hypothetical protein [Paraburkholderia fungorum]PRZ51901.1 hypothetical protein BX589_117203 [Paraburkholderia fungorum]
MHRLLYLAPFIVAIVDVLGYVQIQVSATTLLIVTITVLLVLDIHRALRIGRLLFRVRNSVVFLTACLLLVAGFAAAIVAADSSSYDGPGALYVAITPYVMFFPCVWIVITQRMDKQRLLNVLDITTRVALTADIVISILQIGYLTFIDPSGYIFVANQRLNSVAQFSDIRLVGLFASGLDHGFFLSISALLLWVMAAEGIVGKTRFLISLVVISVLVYFTYTRTAYIVYIFVISMMIGRRVMRRFGVAGLIAIVVLIGIFSGIMFAALDAERAVSGLVKTRSLLNLQTLESRYGSWAYYQNYLEQTPESLLVGGGILQSSFPFIKSPPPLIDNLYLSLLLYGGVGFLLSYSAYMSHFAYIFFSAFRRRAVSEFDKRLYLSLSASVVIVATAGCSATVWDLLSIGLPATVLWALGWSYRRELGRLSGIGGLV